MSDIREWMDDDAAYRRLLNWLFAEPVDQVEKSSDSAPSDRETFSAV